MLIVADKNGVTDGSAHTLLQQVKTDKTIVLVAWSENYVFNDALLNIKDYVLVCFCEYGWDWDLEQSGAHIWGLNSDKFPRYYNGDWIKFDNWVKENPPKLFLKRELLKQDVSDTIRPIEYPSLFQESEVETKEKFENRKINCFNYWGRSNEQRLRLHGEIWINAYRTGAAVCDNLYYLGLFLQNENSNDKWVTFNIPHYARVDVSGLIQVAKLSKICISQAGAGLKCFRHGEVTINSIMATENNNLAWSYEWENGVNCIKFSKYKEVDTIKDFLSKQSSDRLYKIYLNGVENAKNYFQPTYIKNYLEPLINNA